MHPKSIITPELVRAELDYDPSTGVFLWQPKPRRRRRAGCVRSDGYLMIRIQGVLHYAHRLAWCHAMGEWPADQIDHINGDPGDNRLSNLRAVDGRTNSENKRTAASSSTHGFFGVQRNHNGWQALIQSKGKRYCLGTYQTPEEAHQAYLRKKRELHAGCTI